MNPNNPIESYHIHIHEPYTIFNNTIHLIWLNFKKILNPEENGKKLKFYHFNPIIKSNRC